jgi:hypothetical protein
MVHNAPSNRASFLIQCFLVRRFSKQYAYYDAASEVASSNSNAFPAMDHWHLVDFCDPQQYTLFQFRSGLHPNLPQERARHLAK